MSVSLLTTCSRLVQELENREQAVDILINNAGIYGNRQTPEGSTAEEVKQNLFEAENSTFDNWTDVYATNVAAVYFVTTAFLPLLQRASESRSGWTSTVINISSINGLIKESLSRFASNSAKAATIHLTKMLAVEIAKCKLPIRVNSIAPGLFPSEITTGISDDTQKSPPLPAGTCSEISARRPGNDVDMASAILFAATNQYINGQIIAVDGGYLVKYGKL
jgi:NAD(P)-dependent dehydrogenase (short-subunit alcohol dehydrogenase family)